MPDATLDRAPTAHVEGEIENGAPVGELDREKTGRVRARLRAADPGE